MADQIEVPAADMTGAAAPTRQQLVDQLFFNQHNELECLAYDAYPQLDFRDCEKVLLYLSEMLATYTEPADAVVFGAWASHIVAREAARYRITTELLTTYARVIHAAIHRSKIDTAIDLAVEHADLFQEVAHLIFQRAHQLADVGTAKTSTRLTALVMRHIKLYHSNKNNRRHRLNRERLESGLPYGLREIVTERELASERAA